MNILMVKTISSISKTKLLFVSLKVLLHIKILLSVYLHVLIDRVINFTCLSSLLIYG